MTLFNLMRDMSICINRIIKCKSTAVIKTITRGHKSSTEIIQWQGRYSTLNYLSCALLNERAPYYLSYLYLLCFKYFTIGFVCKYNSCSIGKIVYIYIFYIVQINFIIISYFPATFHHSREALVAKAWCSSPHHHTSSLGPVALFSHFFKFVV